MRRLLTVFSPHRSRAAGARAGAGAAAATGGPEAADQCADRLRPEARHHLAAGRRFPRRVGRHGRARRLLQGKPVVLSFDYYECPMLCTVQLQGFVSALGVLTFDAGREFEVLTVSFDPADGPARGDAYKKGYLERYRRPTANAGWHFLTGDEAAIKRLAEAVGFRYAWDEETQAVRAPGRDRGADAGRAHRAATCTASSTRPATCASRSSRLRAARSATASTRRCSTATTTIPPPAATAPRSCASCARSRC